MEIDGPQVSAADSNNKDSFLGSIFTPIPAAQLQPPIPVLLEATANKTMKTAKIKLQETQGFNVENPSNAKGKNHGRQPTRTSLYRVCVYNA